MILVILAKSRMILLVSLLFCLGQACAAEGVDREVELHFPGPKSLGTVWQLTPRSKLTSEYLKKDQPVAALGDLHLRPLAPLIFCPNYQAVESNLLVKAIAGGGIDAMDCRNLPFDDERLACLRNFPNLRRLDLAATDTTDKSMAAVGALKKLVYLGLNRTLVSTRGMAAIGVLPNLEALHLSYTPLGGGTLETLASQPALATLYLDRTQLSDSQVKSLCGIKHLKDLKISFNKGITDLSITYILNLKELKRLSLNETGVTMKGLRRLKALHLNRLDIQFDQYSAAELAELKEWLKPTVISEGSGKRRVPIEIFAPLH